MNKQKTKKKRRLRGDNYSVMCRAIGRYLGKHGWNVFVIGDAQIRSRSPSLLSSLEYQN